MFWTEVLRGKKKKESCGMLWSEVLVWYGIKEERRKKIKEKSVGTWVEEKKRGKKKEKKKKEGEPTCVERKKKEIISQYFHNIFTINLKVGYY